MDWLAIVVENPSADSKTRPKPTHVEVPLETASNGLAGNCGFIKAYFLNFAPLCGMKINAKWGNLNDFFRHIKKPGKNLSLKYM
jgi:hypothetical protein